MSAASPPDECERCGREPASEPLAKANGQWLCLPCHDYITNESGGEPDAE